MPSFLVAVVSVIGSKRHAQVINRPCSGYGRFQVGAAPVWRARCQVCVYQKFNQAAARLIVLEMVAGLGPVG